ncbi:MAG: discoidin domain-containing protein [bacterium]|nr:discoidin domain-containing protein [bacterium]
MKTVAVLAVFLILSGLFTWPLILHLSTAFDNDMDAMMGVCALEWLGRNIWTQPGRLFEAPLYFPRPRPLMTGFHTYGVAFLFFPLRLLAGHPLAAFNLLHILTLGLNGFAMYLLVRRLAGDGLAGLIAGMVFAFCPFRTSNFQHIPFMTNWWAVFSLLALCRFFEGVEDRAGPRTAYFHAAAALYLAQCLSDIVTGIYFGAVLIPFAALNLAANRQRIGRGTLARVALSCGMLAAVLCALLLPLGAARGELGRERTAWDLELVQEISPFLSSYVSAPAGNILYGEISRGLSLNSRQPNFYGLAAWALAAIGAGHLLRARRSPGGRAPRCAGMSPRGFALFFVAAVLAAVILSLGPEIHLMPGRPLCAGPHMLIYRWIPQIRWLRTLGGLGMVSLLSLGILAGFGAARLLDLLARSGLCRRWIAGGALLAVVAAESASHPPTSWGEPFHFVPAAPPAVYQWLMARPDRDHLIELPMPWEPEEVMGAFGLDTVAMYWSIFHGRRIVNGQTAFYYPEYKLIVDQMRNFPSRETIDILRALGVRYVIVRVGRLPRMEWQEELLRTVPAPRYDWRGTLDRLDRFAGELALRVKDGGDRLYEILPAERPPAPPLPLGVSLPRDGWTATSTVPAHDANRAIDGDHRTAWRTEFGQWPGVRFTVDMGREHTITGIDMLLMSVDDCPKNPRIEVSRDGAAWEEIKYEGAYLDFILRLLENPRDRLFRISFPPARARFVRMTLTRLDNIHPVTIADLAIRGAGGGASRRFRAGGAGS